MLKILCELNAVSGNENSVSDFLISQLSGFADSYEKDSMGNLVFFKKGKNPTGRKVAVFAHMDEVGFIVNNITDDGYLKFANVGGIDDRIVLTQRVTVGENKIKGIVGIKAVHLQSKDERKRVIKLDEMYIDIGAVSKEDAQRYVQRGDYVAFDSKYTHLFGSRYKAKAVDDRAGCAVIAELMKKSYDEDIYFCFTVQEEMGLRGAKVLSRRINPDISFVLEATTASDTAFTEKHLHVCSLGGGAVLSLMDRASYSDKLLNKFVMDIADKNGIKYQYKLGSNGGNDAGALQSDASGSRVCSVSLPCRYIHSPICTFDMEDFNSVKALMESVLVSIHIFEDPKHQYRR